MDKPTRRIVVIGGGITGLSAAYYTMKRCEELQIPVDITLIEKERELGGRINTLHRSGYMIEKGPDSFLARKLPMIDLSRELGLEDELAATNPQARTNYILHKGKLQPMPLGLVLGIPTKVTPFLKTGLLSPLGKLRAAMDLLLPAGKGMGDEALGSFIKRRLGKEVLANITEPLLAGIYAGETQNLSLQATFPQFKQMEEKHRSLILGMLAGSKLPPPQSGGLPEIARHSMFLSYKGGLMTLVNRLREALASVRIIEGHGVERMEGWDGRYELIMNQGQRLQGDGIIMALPSFAAAKLLPELPASSWLEQIPYISVANIALAYRREEVPFPLNGSGFVVPRREARMMTACTWSSSKWPHAAPADGILLRTYIGRSGSQDWLQLSDTELIAAVRRDLRDLMGITSEPCFYEITRCVRSMPQYGVGHLERLQEARTQLKSKRPGVLICGAGYDGVGLPDCVQQGKRAAVEMAAYMSLMPTI
ncbi:protoporphyrinogen oxidase [Paenibacillus oenotherae]|uniref:Coproporphyrinogen III oxidase n=1 Tax=Paenibacillus oenotherae TaxID=1435645 RepID=A0ABS7D6V5_9BACL|nr:protoporphyrinogen oxidase [Paenibacillus oenotherae]MBW7475251.1 protoporphyrinogen oxidase [Paenibacillus oenotherae]